MYRRVSDVQQSVLFLCATIKDILFCNYNDLGLDFDWKLIKNCITFFHISL